MAQLAGVAICKPGRLGGAKRIITLEALSAGILKEALTLASGGAVNSAALCRGGLEGLLEEIPSLPLEVAAAEEEWGPSALAKKPAVSGMPPEGPLSLGTWTSVCCIPVAGHSVPRLILLLMASCFAAVPGRTCCTFAAAPSCLCLELPLSRIH